MKKIPAVMIAFSLAFAYICGENTVNASEQLTDIHITVETKEIHINRIPENRRVSVDVYIENAPPFALLTFVSEIDSRLEFQPANHFSAVNTFKNYGSSNIGLGTRENPDVASFSIFSYMNTLMECSGCFARVNVILPEDVQEGDFYSIDLIRESDFSDQTSIALGNSMEDFYGNECFLQLNGGGILITPAAILGDVNGDETFNIADAAALQKWLLCIPDAKLADWQAGDLCEDGKLNAFDLCMMKRELLKGE